MLKAVITFHDGSKALAINIGFGEEVKAPRDLAALEKSGWVIDDNVTLAYKAYLAGKRQGDIAKDVRFEDWVDNVDEIDARPSRKQIDAAVALGEMTAEQADMLINLYGDDGEEKVVTPLA